MKVGDLIYDSHYGQAGLVIEIPVKDGWGRLLTSYTTVLYEDGHLDRSVRINDPEFEVVS
tara:strand:- start:15537 stop:15716 length:180 start_codon:yes stop_codon:yes gene_type:complete